MSSATKTFAGVASCVRHYVFPRWPTLFSPCVVCVAGMWCLLAQLCFPYFPFLYHIFIQRKQSVTGCSLHAQDIPALQIAQAVAGITPVETPG